MSNAEAMEQFLNEVRQRACEAILPEMRKLRIVTEDDTLKEVEDLLPGHFEDALAAMPGNPAAALKRAIEALRDELIAERAS